MILLNYFCEIQDEIDFHLSARLTLKAIPVQSKEERVCYTQTFRSTLIVLPPIAFEMSPSE